MARPPVDTSKAADFWRANLDPQNLGHGRESRLAMEDEIAFQDTPDHRAAFDWLAGAFSAGDAPVVLDLGAGLGAVSLWLARRGARVIALDSSPARLRGLRRRAREAGCGDRIVTVAGTAEALPIASGALRAVFTKSVLIHTDLPRAADEIARVLSEGGRAALNEPQPGNPFAALYRRTLAPKEWQGITRYFGPGEQRIFLHAIGSGSGGVRSFYFFAFLAFVFQFAIPSPRLFHFLLAVLHTLDRILLGLLPFAGRFAWFGLITIEHHRASGQESNPARGGRD